MSRYGVLRQLANIVGFDIVSGHIYLQRVVEGSIWTLANKRFETGYLKLKLLVNSPLS